MSKVSGHRLLIAVVLSGIAFIGFQIYQFNKAFGIHDQRVVQILDSADGSTRAELVRRYALFDLNFMVFVNGQKIYTSPDFDGTYKIAYRETICWDTSGKDLVLEIAGRRLFGYNLATKRRLTDRELLALKIQYATPRELGLEGRWPDEANR